MLELLFVVMFNSPPLAISFNVLVSRPKDFIYIGWIFVLLSIVCLAYAAWRTAYAWRKGALEWYELPGVWMVEGKWEIE